MSLTVSFLGCGWLGLPLAQQCVKAGMKVKGSTTSPEKCSILNQNKIEPFLLNVEHELEGQDLKRFFKSDVLVLTIPFKRSLVDPVVYLYQIQAIIEAVVKSSIKYVIFSSSTSIYSTYSGEVVEDSQVDQSQTRSVTLSQIEQLLLDHQSFDAAVLRFSGLYGEDRKIGRFLSGRKDNRDPLAPVNLVHLDDCVAICLKLIQAQPINDIFNICSDKHPIRQDLYTKAAQNLNLEIPKFIPSQKREDYKVVNNDKIKAHLNYVFKYPDPIKAI